MAGLMSSAVTSYRKQTDPEYKQYTESLFLIGLFYKKHSKDLELSRKREMINT